MSVPLGLSDVCRGSIRVGIFSGADVAPGFRRPLPGSLWRGMVARND